MDGCWLPKSSGDGDRIVDPDVFHRYLLRCAAPMWQLWGIDWRHAYRGMPYEEFERKAGLAQEILAEMNEGV